MRTHGNLALKTAITAKDIEYVLSLRRAYDSIKKRLEIAENTLTKCEDEIMARISAGAIVVSPYTVQLKKVERRNIAWMENFTDRSHPVSRLGATSDIEKVLVI
ncbi:MAG: hypothetical protein WA160_05715 [Pseudobdellovibrio sp.]